MVNYGVHLRKTELVPYYVDLLRPEVHRSTSWDFPRRPVLTMVGRILQIRLGALRVRGGGLGRYVILSRL